MEHIPEEARAVGAHLKLGLEHVVAEVFGQSRTAMQMQRGRARNH